MANTLRHRLIVTVTAIDGSTLERFWVAVEPATDAATAAAIVRTQVERQLEHADTLSGLDENQ